jgi:DNA-binding GntR family transcriptional regulator
MTTETLSSKAYKNIQERIFSGSLPVGSVVSEVSLANEIGVSRTPVREAVRRLCVDGLLEQVPGYGTIVRRQSRREMIELYQLREALESYAVGVAAQNISNQDMARLEILCDKMRTIAHELRDSNLDALDSDGMGSFLAVDMAFHILLIRSAGNSRITKLASESRMLTGCFFRTNRRQHDLHIVAGAYRFHRRIFQAVQHSDVEKACRLTVEHIHAGMQGMIKQYDKIESASSPSDLTNMNLSNDLLKELINLGMDGLVNI